MEKKVHDHGIDRDETEIQRSALKEMIADLNIELVPPGHGRRRYSPVRFQRKVLFQPDSVIDESIEMTEKRFDFKEDS